MNNYLKPLGMVAATILSAVVAALTGDQALSPTEWLNVALVAVGAVGTAVVPELDKGIARYAKPLVAVGAAVLTLATNLIIGGVDLSEWLQLAIAGLGALGISALPGRKHQRRDYDLAG